MSPFIPNAPFREAVLQAIVAPLALQVTAAELASRCGWLTWQHGRRVGDAARLKRTVGLMKTPSPRGPRTRDKLRYTDAVKITLALGKDPVDLGV